MKIFGFTIPQTRKAWVAVFTPGVVALGAALTESSPGATAITSAEWLAIVISMVGTGGLVFLARNAPHEPASSGSEQIPPG